MCPSEGGLLTYFTLTCHDSEDQLATGRVLSIVRKGPGSCVKNDSIEELNPVAGRDDNRARGCVRASTREDCVHTGPAGEAALFSATSCCRREPMPQRGAGRVHSAPAPRHPSSGLALVSFSSPWPLPRSALYLVRRSAPPSLPRRPNDRPPPGPGGYPFDRVLFPTGAPADRFSAEIRQTAVRARGAHRRIRGRSPGGSLSPCRVRPTSWRPWCWWPPACSPCATA